MELTAYVNGDVILITRILSQIAMIFDGNTFAVAAKLFGLIGIVVGLLSGMGRASFSPVTLIWPVIFATIAIIPRVDLVIEDRMGGLSRVDDLPVGFAAPVSLITTVGQGITRLMTENLGLDDIAITMDNGHLVAVRAPIAYQQVITDPKFQGEAAILPNGLSPIKDTSKYIEACIGPVAKTQANANSIYSLQNLPLAQLRVDSSPSVVMGSNGQSYECPAMYDALMAGLTSSEYQRSLNSAINQNFSKYADDTTTGPRYQMALENTVSDVGHFYAAIAFSNALSRVTADITVAAGGGSHNAALEDALNQKREKNQGTAAMVFETISHSIGFIEVYSFSILPLMLLLIMIGSAGARIGVKYFWMLVWIQLWFPTILVVMAYMDAQLGVIAIGSTYSAASVNQFLNELLRLQDVGYLQLSTATGLSMMLVFGASSFMASTYQRDLTGEQHYDPKKNAPDTLSRAPQTAFQPQWSHTEAGGRIGTGSREAFAGATFNIDTRRTSGVSFSQLESFARDGSTTLSTNVGHSEQALNTTSFGTDTTTTGRETVSSSNGADILHTVAAGMVGSIGDANTKNDSYSQANQFGVASQVGASAGAGVGAGGNGGGAPGAGVSAGATANANITMTHLQSEGNQRSTVATDDVSSRVVKSDSSKVSVGEEISNASSERSGEQSLKSESAQTSEDLRVQTGETRGSSQSESQTASEMTTKTTSTPYDAILAANQIARDDTLYSWLSQTVANNGELNSAVNNFMDRHSTKLDHTFHPNDDKARFAFAASYVMQGLEANDLFSSDADGGVARRAAINAMSDEIILSTGYGNVGEGKTPSIEDLRKRDAPKPEDIPAMMGSRFKGYELTKGAVDEQIGKLPNTGDSGQIYQSFLSGLGVDGGSLAKENGNAILSHMRAKIDRENGPIVENEQGLLQVYREAGTVAAIQNLLWKDNESVRKEAVLDTYDNSLRNGSSQIGISTSIAQRVITGVSPEHDPNNAQELGATMLDNRMRELYGKGMASKDDNGVAKYMTLAQFEAGANETGNQALSEFFSKERANMAKQDEVFANPEVASRITTLSMLGTSPESMGGNIVRAQQEYMLGSMERHLENDIGQDLSTDGSNVRWGLLPSRRMGGRGADTDGGRSTYPTGSPEDRLLSLIGSVEAPDGYDTFEYASHRNPPPMPLTSMTIGEVKQWQDQRIMGAETRAAGQYQMTGGSDPKRTFAKTTAALGLSDDQLFSAEVQDSMGMYLAKQSGFNDFMRGDLQTEDFGLQLSKVWAAFPNITGSNPDNSYYEGLQGNKAQIGADFMTAFLRDLNPRNQ